MWILSPQRLHRLVHETLGRPLDKSMRELLILMRRALLEQIGKSPTLLAAQREDPSLAALVDKGRLCVTEVRERNDLT